MNRQVLVFSGLPFSGKSYLLKRVAELLASHQPVIVRMDPIRERLYGNRADTHVTRSEHLFKNEVTRYQILEHLVLGAPLVMVEMLMLTRADHQQPFVEMINRARKYILDIERECCLRDGQEPPTSPTKVDLRVVLAYASPAITAQRADTPSEERQRSSAAVMDLVGIGGALKIFEFPAPNLYVPLPVDTSDESGETTRHRLQEIVAFSRGEWSLPDDERECRLTRAQAYFQELKQLVLG